MSNSVRFHRWQPTSLPCPWDSPGKNTRVGCHLLFQCMKVKVKSLSRVRLLATPWTAAYQAPPYMGFSRQEYWSGGTIAFSRTLLIVTSKCLDSVIENPFVILIMFLFSLLFYQLHFCSLALYPLVSCYINGKFLFIVIVCKLLLLQSSTTSM